MKTKSILNSVVMFLENDDNRYQSMMILKGEDGRYFLVTATNSRKFAISEIDIDYIKKNYGNVV